MILFGKYSLLVGFLVAVWLVCLANNTQAEGNFQQNEKVCHFFSFLFKHIINIFYIFKVFTAN
jgi:hypothetical protein